MIPKTIFQTYSCAYEDLPSYIKNCTDTWKERNPDFDYVYMSEKECYEFILNNYSQRHADIYAGLTHKAMKGDWWRYLIVNKLGGVYMDIDTVCRKPLSSVLDLDNDFITSLDLVPDALFTQWGFASKSNSPVLENLINHVLDNYDEYPGNKQLIETDLTGPVAFQRSVGSVLGDNIQVLINLCNIDHSKHLDFAEENSQSIDQIVESFNDLDQVKSNKFKLYFWTFNNAARHFTSAWRWSDHTIDDNIINKMIKHKCDNINYEYADIKIHLKKPSYSSFGFN
jgi:mannosyltransferase OCH1-like enzyme